VAPVHAQVRVSLRQALQQARTASPVLQTQFLNADVARADVVTAALKPNPVLNNQTLLLLRPSLYPEGTSVFNPQNHQIWWQLTKRFQRPIQRRTRVELAERNVALVQSQYADAERNLLTDAANAWLDAWSARVRYDLLLQAQANVDSLVRINEVRLRNQVITQTDLIRTRLLSEQYTLQLRSTQQEYRGALQALRFFLGTTDSLDIDAAAPVEWLAVEAPPDTLLSQTLARRPDVEAARRNIFAAQSNLAYQKVAWLPVPELGAIWNPQNGIPYLGAYGTVEIPIFSRNQGEIQKARVQQVQAERNLRAVQVQAQTQLIAAYQTYQTQRGNVERFRSILDQSDRVLNTVRYAYLRGGTTIIDFLEAQRSWFDTRQLYNDALLQYRRSYVQLLSATGRIQDL
jgi:cobalt-zinc-cadmium efflux system outer membrane protein